jgi:hypothetical protein
MWCVAELNETYIEKMEDVLAVYEKALSSAEPVVCVDEKPVTLHKDVREPIPMKPGRVANVITSMNAVEPRTCFAGSSPKPESISQK